MWIGIVLVSSKGEPMKREIGPDRRVVRLGSHALCAGALSVRERRRGVRRRSTRPTSSPRASIRRAAGSSRCTPSPRCCSTRVAFKNIISNGLVLDKNGNKMSKRLGNGVDPFEVLGHLRSRRHALVHDLQLAAVGQPQIRQGRRGRSAPQVLRNALQYLFVLRPLRQRGRIYGPGAGGARGEASGDRPLDHLAAQHAGQGRDAIRSKIYDPTPAARAIQEFVGENLSNWYVRLNRKRFWGGGMNEDKLAAYQTLYTCLETVSMLAAPFAPFISDRIFCGPERRKRPPYGRIGTPLDLPEGRREADRRRSGRDDVAGPDAYRRWCWPCAAKSRSRCASR